MKTTRHRIYILGFALALAASSLHATTNTLPAPMPEFMNAEELAEWRATKTAEFEAKKAQEVQMRSVEADVFYTGKPYLEETGTYAFRFRSYDPELSRWTSADPSGFPDGANNNAYMAVPTMEFDWQGLFALSTTTPSVASITDAATGNVTAYAWNLQAVSAGGWAATHLQSLLSVNSTLSSASLDGAVTVSDFFVQNHSSPQTGQNPNLGSVSLRLTFGDAPSGFGWIQMQRVRLPGRSFSAWALDISSGAGPGYTAGPTLYDVPAVGSFVGAPLNDGDGGSRELYTFAAIRDEGVASHWTIYDGIFWGGHVYE